MIGKIWKVSNFCRNYLIQGQLMKMNSKRKRIVLLQNGETLKNKLKHLLFILISILLLSSPVIGDSHKGETLYGWGKTLPYVWKGFGDKKTHPMYHGGVENGVPSGLGILILPNGNKYVGGWEDGRRNGQGTFTTSNGSKYEGEWKSGERHGQGTHTYPDGSMYEGVYKDDWELNGTQYDTDGKIISKYVNGKWIKQ